MSGCSLLNWATLSLIWFMNVGEPHCMSQYFNVTGPPEFCDSWSPEPPPPPHAAVRASRDAASVAPSAVPRWRRGNLNIVLLLRGCLAPVGAGWWRPRGSPGDWGGQPVGLRGGRGPPPGENRDRLIGVLVVGGRSGGAGARSAAARRSA